MKILLIGDRGLDRYHYGTVKRISPEAPVPIISSIFKTVEKPGMAANVAENLRALGNKVFAIYGTEFCTRTRYIDSRSNQHLLRIDEDHTSPVLKLDGCALADYKGIVISDYLKGSINYEIVERLRHEYNGPIFIDSKKTDLKRFEGCFVKVNQLEDELAVTKPDHNYIVTQGRNGARCGRIDVPSPQVEAHDACGAGDSFLSAFVHSYLQNSDIRESIGFANRAASVTVLHTGVYAPKLAEINTHFGRFTNG